MESLLIIDKKPGPTSFDVVRNIRRSLGREKVGHTGSLDPFASGVLILLVGRATKLSHVLLNADKSYRATVKLGEATDSMDRTGLVTEKKAIPELTAESLTAFLKGYEGTWEQTPPMYSAKKQQGVRLYELARKNIEVPREPIPVELYRMDFISWNSPFLEFEVHCSKGTYIRSLADDLGRKLGTVAHLAELRRLSCGPFPLSEAIEEVTFVQDPQRYVQEGYSQFLKLLRTETLHAPAAFHRRSAAQGLPSQIENGNRQRRLRVERYYVEPN